MATVPLKGPGGIVFYVDPAQSISFAASSATGCVVITIPPHPRNGSMSTFTVLGSADSIQALLRGEQPSAVH